MKLRCTIRRDVLLHSYSERDRPSAMNVLADQEVLYRALGVQRLLNLNDVIRLLRSEVKRAGSQRAFAKKAGVNVSVVSKTLRGMVLPSEKILSALDLRVVYLSKMTLCLVGAAAMPALLAQSGHGNHSQQFRG